MTICVLLLIFNASRFVSSSPVLLRSTKTIRRHPSRTKPSAIAWPIPLAAPVTRATLIHQRLNGETYPLRSILVMYAELSIHSVSWRYRLASRLQEGFLRSPHFSRRFPRPAWHTSPRLWILSFIPETLFIATRNHHPRVIGSTWRRAQPHRLDIRVRASHASEHSHPYLSVDQLGQVFLHHPRLNISTSVPVRCLFLTTDLSEFMSSEHGITASWLTNRYTLSARHATFFLKYQWYQHLPLRNSALAAPDSYHPFACICSINTLTKWS